MKKLLFVLLVSTMAVGMLGIREVKGQFPDYYALIAEDNYLITFTSMI